MNIKNNGVNPAGPWDRQDVLKGLCSVRSRPGSWALFRWPSGCAAGGPVSGAAAPPSEHAVIFWRTSEREDDAVPVIDRRTPPRRPRGCGPAAPLPLRCEGGGT